MNRRGDTLSSRFQSGDSLMSYKKRENSIGNSFDSLESELFKSESDSESKPKDYAHKGKLESKLTGKARNVTERLYRPPPLKFKYTGKEKQEKLPIRNNVETRGKNASPRKPSLNSVAEPLLSSLPQEESQNQDHNEDNCSLDEETQTTEDLNGIPYVISAVDFVSLLYSPQSVIVELMEAKLSYTMGQTETIMQSIEKQLDEAVNNCDQARDERNELYRIVSEYIKNLKENIEKSKAYIQTCRLIMSDLRYTASKSENKEKRELFLLRRKAAIEAFRLERLQVENEFIAIKSRISFSKTDIAEVDNAVSENPYTNSGQSLKHIIKRFASIRKHVVLKERGYSSDQPTKFLSKKGNTTIPSFGKLRLK